jgi:hypothetical protein
VLTPTENYKGVMDVDTVKGCTFGMAEYRGGCYGECYACRTASRYKIDFSIGVSRKITNKNASAVFNTVKANVASWYRIGTAGDPSQDWENTVEVCEFLQDTHKVPVIITKHWKTATDKQLDRLAKVDCVINTSTSGMDTDYEIKHRVGQIERIARFGIESVCRVVTCEYGDSDWAMDCTEKEDYLLTLAPVIDNPLRATKKNNHVMNGDILLTKCGDSIGGGSKYVSLHDKSVFLGKCCDCPDQCGAKDAKEREVEKKEKYGTQLELYDVVKPVMPETKKKKKKYVDVKFDGDIEYITVESVIGSGYEDDVGKLAIEDGVAYRAARKNMQIHSAIILMMDGEFSGFFTFQVNHVAKEFCLLQSAMALGKENRDIYKGMLNKIIEQNTYGYPMVMTVSTKHDLECPKVLEAVGFQTYLDLSGYAYMVHGTLEQVRMKRLCHATMTNAWITTRADWLKMKKEWNTKIEEAGEKHDVPNPKFASRDGCWQGSNGYSNVVLTERVIEDGKVKTNKGKSFNGNASVLDPVACEVILRFFMPTKGKRVYNPFGGGVQFGFVSGSYGYEYIASEIRQNQCDANNAICQDLDSATWIQGDSSTYKPKGKFDLCFTCPPYYKVEKYVDYDGVIPDGELNDMPTYEVFRDTLFAGYKMAIERLKDNRFFVVMTGDSRDKDGAYYGCEAEHELFFKEQGLHIYNKIVYLECEFTRLAHAKRTLDYRKFPKREQKILVFYKGDMKKIKDDFPPIGRL